MKRTFIIAAAALIAIDLVFTQRWERIIRERAVHLNQAIAALDANLVELRDKESRLVERESIAGAMFEALADARSALLATVQNLENDDEAQE
jgi:hypothetical protein